MMWNTDASMESSVEEEPRPGLRAQLPRLLRWAPGVVATMLIVLFCISAAQRVRSVLEFEQHEGYAVETVGQAAHGGSLYPAPSVTFVPYMYAPGYYYTTAEVVRLTHQDGFVVARAVSIASTFGAFAMIFLLVWKETRNKLAALSAVGLYAGAYPLCQAWFDIARVDSFYVFVVLCAIYATRWLHPVLAALVWIAAVQSKQPVLPVAFVMLCWDFRLHARRTVAGLLTFVVGLGVVIAVATHLTGPWYSFYMFTVPRAVADILLRPLALFLFSYLFAPFGITCVLVAAAASLVLRSGVSRVAGFYLTSLSIFLITWYEMGHDASTFNVLMPMCAWLGVLLGLAIARLQRLPWPGMTEIVMLGVTIQLAACIYNPGQWKASPNSRASAAALLTLLRRTPGDVYVAWHPYYGMLAGKPERTDFNALEDTLRGLKPAQADTLRASIADSLCRGTTALVLDGPDGVSQLGNLLHRGEGWNHRFTQAAIIPGVDLTFRPAWIAYARGGDAAVPACIQSKP